MILAGVNRMKLILCFSLLALSQASLALPLASVKDQLRAELWHEGLQENPQQKQAPSKPTILPKPFINEELDRALVKYKL